MTSADRLAYDTAPDSAAIQAVKDGLIAYNRAQAPDAAFQPLSMVLRDPTGRVVGGLVGATYGGWLVIQILWVAEERRGHGYGRTLLTMAEQEARRRGCHHAHLDTMSFQARPFYEHAGYTVLGTRRDLPQGHSRSFIQKALAGDERA